MNKIVSFCIVLALLSISILSCAAPQETKPAPEAKTPASFTVSNLTITPGTVNQGENVTISADVTNSGETAGNYTVVLKINGTQEATQLVTLDPGASKKVDFPVSRSDAGDYSVSLESLTGKFTVAVKPPTKTTTLSDAEFNAILHTLTGEIPYYYSIYFLSDNKMFVKSPLVLDFTVGVCDGKFCIHNVTQEAWDFIYSHAQKYFTYTDNDLLTLISVPDTVMPKMFGPDVKTLPTVTSVATSEGNITITYIAQ